jgi:hypothetical protein
MYVPGKQCITSEKKERKKAYCSSIAVKSLPSTRPRGGVESLRYIKELSTCVNHVHAEEDFHFVYIFLTPADVPKKKRWFRSLQG